jgi:cytochrome c oxidase subunit 2
MTPQMKAFWLFAGTNVLLVIPVFVWVLLSTRREREFDIHTAYRLRRRFLFVLAAVLVVAIVLTFPAMPYPKAGQHPERVVYVVGEQFAWGISDQPITNDEQWSAAASSGPVQIPAGQLVEFRVTSFDVNHDFGVYSPKGQLLGQVQAMPGYVNRLRLRFRTPGTYPVLCLELCGMGHHGMRSEFDVVPGRQAKLAGPVPQTVREKTNR